MNSKKINYSVEELNDLLERIDSEIPNLINQMSEKIELLETELEELKNKVNTNEPEPPVEPDEPEIPEEPEEILYDSPNLTIENGKAKATKDGVSQYFDVSYTPNTGHSKYQNNVYLTDDEGKEYYLSLLSEGTSPFVSNGNHYDSGGWYSLTNGNGGEYPLGASILAINNFDGNIKIKDETGHRELVEKALEMYNRTFPMLNATIDDNATNIIKFNANDPTFNQNPNGTAYTIVYSDHFIISVHPDRMANVYGAYSEDNINWLSILVHELGHTLGMKDNASHTPSIMNYGMDPSKCTYMQPNDIAFLKYLHQTKYGVDIPTIQEETDPLKATNKMLRNSIDLDAIRNIIENDPTIGEININEMK